MAAIPGLRAYSGLALLSYGFRPFFLGAAAWAGFGILIWLPLLTGDLTVPTAFSPLDWHIHEMLRRTDTIRADLFVQQRSCRFAVVRTAHKFRSVGYHAGGLEYFAAISLSFCAAKAGSAVAAANVAPAIRIPRRTLRREIKNIISCSSS